MTSLTYGQFLALFLLPPITGLILLTLRDQRDQRDRRAAGPTEKREQGVRGVSRRLLLAGLVVVAMLYTIPWDNHLIAQGVWSYDPSRVSGITLGQIPLEEILFFPLQTLLVGLWVFWLTPRIMPGRRDTRDVARARAHLAPISGAPITRWVAVVAVGVLWLTSLVILLRGWRAGTYLGWELAWALPPLALQLGLGADLLWRRRWLLLAALLPAVGYLAAADAVAIHAGIWTIALRQSLGALVGGVLPLEELIFFLLTTALIVAGLVLGEDLELRKRLRFGVSESSRDTTKPVPAP